MKNLLKKNFTQLKLITQYQGDILELKKFNKNNIYKCALHLPVAALLMNQKHLFLSSIVCYFASSNLSQYIITKKLLNNIINKIYFDKENLSLEIHIGVYKEKILNVNLIDIEYISDVNEIIKNIDEDKYFIVNMSVTNLDDKQKYFLTLTIDNINNLILDKSELILILKKDFNRIKSDLL